MNKVQEIISNLQRGLDNVQWQAQLCDVNSILFYKVTKQSQEIIDKHLANCKAKYIFCNKEIEGIEVINIVEDFVETQKLICDKLYPLPQYSSVIGITGTNGKSTSTFILSELISLKKKNVCLVGTLGVYYNGIKQEDFNLTTPAYIDLRKSLNQLSKDDDVLILEVSSHGLEQKRIYGFELDLSAWTSFSQDHLDYYKTMDAYFISKKKILDISKGHLKVPSSQKELLSKLAGEKIETVARVDESFYKHSFFQSDYNKDNLDLCLSILRDMNIKIKPNDLFDINYPPGRFQLIENQSQRIIIDFAHTPDALENLTSGIKNSFKEKIVVVFGCGGDRDRSKRPLMGHAAEKFADTVYLTSDNPRFEDPQQILEDTKKGFKKKGFIEILDRAKAIEQAIEDNPEAIIVIAGKGHEPYLDIKGVKHPYSDEATVKDIING
jgi:UDP-N-acetylmuramoyl-L-alanyl-D-glutamate--2,6-diaminopimelate ligase